MDSHVGNGLQNGEKNKMTGMPLNGFCMIPLTAEFLEHIGGHVENDWNAMKWILYDTTNFGSFGTHGWPC